MHRRRARPSPAGADAGVFNLPARGTRGIAMVESVPDPGLAALLAKFEESGGVLDYVILRAEAGMTPSQLHRAAALAGIAVIDNRLKKRAEAPPYPVERLKWDESKLTGEPVSFASFWGTDDVMPKQLSPHTQGIPDIDGYKTAFFHPPYHLHMPMQEGEILFDRINKFVLGPDPTGCEIVSWSTDWSNYFDAGNEWWGAFYWTVRPKSSNSIVVIGASSTD